MNILSIPARNVRRKPLRALFMILVFALGGASAVSLYYLSGIVGNSLEKKLSAFGANILISPKTESLSVGYGGMRLADVSFEVNYLDQKAATTAVRGIPLSDRISAVAPKFVLLTKIGATPAGVIGVDFPQERSIKSYWAVTGDFPKAGNELLAGADAAKKLGITKGSAVLIEGRPFVATGILAPTGGEDDNVLFADIAAVQEAAGKPGLIHFLEAAALCSGCPIEDITAQLSAALPGTDVKAMSQVVRQRMASIDFVRALALGVAGVILLTSCVMIALSVHAAVNERAPEIGVFRAVGFSRGAVFALFSLEAAFIGAAAGTAGYLAGVVLCNQVLRVLDLAEGATAAPHPAHFVLCLFGASLLSAAASAPAALKAARTEPSQALVSL